MTSKSSLHKQNYYLSLVLLATAMIFFLPGLILNSQAKEGYSADELFDNSLEDLRATMEKARRNNEAFRENNRLLNKEVEHLKEQMSVLETQKATVQQQQGDLSVFSDTTALSEKEKSLYQTRIKNFSSRRSRFEDDKARLEKKIKAYADYNQNAQSRIDQLNKEIEKIAVAADEKKVAVDENGQNFDELKQKIRSSDKRISALKEQLASQKRFSQQNRGVGQQSAKTFSALSPEVSSAEEKLAHLLAEKKFMAREVDAAGSLSIAPESTLSLQIADLENYRNQLKKALGDLQKAVATVRSDNNKGLSSILKEFQQQQVLLKKKMDILTYGKSIAKSPKINKSTDKLLVARKTRLLSQKNQLEIKIAKAQKELDRKTMPAGAALSAKDLELKKNISQSSARLRDLQEQLNALRISSSEGRKNEELVSQVEELEKNLKDLRKKTKDVTLDKDLPLSLSDQSLKDDIAQLESRRLVLAQTVKTIEQKYSHAGVAAQEPADKEAQLNEYLATLTLENTALQERLLILQMRKDKSSKPDL